MLSLKCGFMTKEGARLSKIYQKGKELAVNGEKLGKT